MNIVARWRAAASFLACLSALAPAARAQDTATLERIAATASISLGHRESSVPFSYYDSKHRVIGYSQDLMLKVVDDIRTELKLAAITIKMVPVTSQNRIPLVVNGTVDLECGSTTHTAERSRRVDFSTSIFVVGTRLLTSNNSGIRDFPDLVRKNVVVTSGTTSERLLRKYNEEHSAGIRIIATKEHGESFRVLEAGQADAFMMDDALLYGERAKAQRPESWVVVGTPMSYEAYACAMRKGDAAFKKLVDTSLARMMKSGDALKIYAKWFNQPIPPKGLNLGWPASAALLDLYRVPTDQPIQ